MTPMLVKPIRLFSVGLLVAACFTASTKTAACAQFVKVGNAIYPDIQLPSPMSWTGPLSELMPGENGICSRTISAAAVVPVGQLMQNNYLNDSCGLPVYGPLSESRGGRGYSALFAGHPSYGSYGAAGYAGYLQVPQLIHPADVSPFGLWHPNNWVARTLDAMSP
jgi:hypothetical protein